MINLTLYNLCHKDDYYLFNQIASKRRDYAFRFYRDSFKYYYINLEGDDHCLNGPSAETIEGKIYFYINGLCFPETSYWDHPDVIAYQYIKDHPEMAAFV